MYKVCVEFYVEKLNSVFRRYEISEESLHRTLRVFHSTVYCFRQIVRYTRAQHANSVSRRDQIREEKLPHKLRSREERSSEGFCRRFLPLLFTTRTDDSFIRYSFVDTQYSRASHNFYVPSPVGTSISRRRQIWSFINIYRVLDRINGAEFAPQLRILLMFNRPKC